MVSAHRRHGLTPMASGLIATVILIGAMVGIVVSGIPGGPGVALPWAHKDTIKVQLTSADALAPHASVEIAGVKVGEVRSVDAAGNYAVATLDIDPQYADIHSDAQVFLRPHGLFGPKYIDLTPGTDAAPRVNDGDTISVRNSVQPVDLDQILQALQAPEAQNLRTAFVELGKASAARGDDVNHLLGAANSLTSVLDSPVLAADQVAPNLSDMLVNDEQFNASFSQAPLDQLVANNNTSLQALADNAGHLQSLLDHADSSLTQLDSALSGTGNNIHSIIDTLPATIDKLDTFNKTLALFGANLTGKDSTSKNGNVDVTQGIIDAIENIRSAFASFDPCVNTTPNTLGTNHCPGPGMPLAGQEHYLRVQVFDLGGSAALTQTFCNIPIFSLPAPANLPCPTGSTASYPSVPGADDTVGASLSDFAALLG